MKISRGLIHASVAVVLGLYAGPGMAQEFPNKPIEIVVPFAASGGSDFIARLVASRMAEELDVPVVVLNRPGAGASVALEMVKAASSDGHTLIFATSAFVMNPIFYPEMSADVVSDFVPVTQLTGSSGVLIAHPDLPADNVGELVEYLRGNSEDVTVATYGFGSQSHVNMLAFEQLTGLDLYDVAYSGGGPAIASVMANETQLLFATLLPALPPIEGELVKALGVHSPERVQWLPDTPTFIEGGVDFVHSGFFGLAAPAGAPQNAVDVIAAAAQVALQDERVSSAIIEQGYSVVGSSPSEFAQFLDGERTRWADVIAQSGISLEDLNN